MKSKRLLRGAAGAAVVAIVALFFWRALRDNWAEIREIDLSVGWWTAGTVALFVAAVAVSGSLWGRIMTRLEGRGVPFLEAIRVQFASWLLKYIPGHVGLVVNKLLWAKGRGTSRLLLVLSVVYENAFLLIVSVVPMVPLLLAWRALGGEGLSLSSTVWVGLAVLVPVLVVTHRRIFSLAVNAIAKRTLGRTVPDKHFLSFGESLAFQVGFLVPRVLNGVGICLIASALSDAGPGSWVPLSAAYALAGALGILAFFVPSGLGVRESVFVFFAVQYVPLEQAIVVSLAARILSTVGDAVIAIIYAGLRFGTRTKEPLR
ncbi:MAG: flippase-like domain-containing protein [Demequinaceae bacterium]|nr:flippase-like domain-containing protein [Demequinaceae bacterium]